MDIMAELQLTVVLRWVSTIVALPILFYTSWELYERSKSHSFWLGLWFDADGLYSVWIEGAEESC
jgi:hypothetical protein